MFQDIINLLLEKKANLVADKEAELAMLIAELDAKYADREEQINRLLDDAGYVEPVVEETAEEEVAEEVDENGNVVETASVEEIVEDVEQY